LEQNLALGFTAEPQELQTGPLGALFGNSAGSGLGSSPGVENAAAADMIDGGCPGPGKVETDT
jgi:hypothetical protein